MIFSKMNRAHPLLGPPLWARLVHSLCLCVTSTMSHPDEDGLDSTLSDADLDARRADRAKRKAERDAKGSPLGPALASPQFLRFLSQIPHIIANFSILVFFSCSTLLHVFLPSLCLLVFPSSLPFSLSFSSPSSPFSLCSSRFIFLNSFFCFYGLCRPAQLSPLSFSSSNSAPSSSSFSSSCPSAAERRSVLDKLEAEERAAQEDRRKRQEQREREEREEREREERDKKEWEAKQKARLELKAQLEAARLKAQEEGMKRKEESKGKEKKKRAEEDEDEEDEEDLGELGNLSSDSDSDLPLDEDVLSLAKSATDSSAHPHPHLPPAHDPKKDEALVKEQQAALKAMEAQIKAEEEQRKLMLLKRQVSS